MNAWSKLWAAWVCSGVPRISTIRSPEIGWGSRTDNLAPDICKSNKVKWLNKKLQNYILWITIHDMHLSYRGQIATTFTENRASRCPRNYHFKYFTPSWYITKTSTPLQINKEKKAYLNNIWIWNLQKTFAYNKYCIIWHTLQKPENCTCLCPNQNILHTHQQKPVQIKNLHILAYGSERFASVTKIQELLINLDSV